MHTPQTHSQKRQRATSDESADANKHSKEVENLLHAADSRLTISPYIVSIKSVRLDKFFEGIDVATSSEFLDAMEAATSRVMQRVNGSKVAWYGTSSICVLVIPKGKSYQQVYASGSILDIVADSAATASVEFNRSYVSSSDRAINFRARAFNVTEEQAHLVFSEMQRRNYDDLIHRMSCLHLGPKTVRGMKAVEIKKRLEEREASSIRNLGDTHKYGNLITTSPFDISSVCLNEDPKQFKSFRMSTPVKHLFKGYVDALDEYLS